MIIKIYNKNSLFESHGKISKVLSPLPVDIVLETLMERNIEGYENNSNLRIFLSQPVGWFGRAYRMIRIQLRAIHQDTVSTLVQV